MNRSDESSYTFGYSPTATQTMAARNAKTNAAFFVPHLRAGMTVLDCGCGPGTITLDFAEVVSSGQVVGIDVEASQIDLARAEAVRRGVVNARFDTADVHNLPFTDTTFDAVFGHTILMQFSNPLPALKEMLRVLKPGGICGLREPAFDGNLYEPPDGARQRYLTLFIRVLEYNGGDAKIGRRLAGLLHEAGFGHVTTSASYQVTNRNITGLLPHPNGRRRVCANANVAMGSLSVNVRPYCQ